MSGATRPLPRIISPPAEGADPVLTRLGLRLTPAGQLLCAPDVDMPGMAAGIADRLRQAFARGSRHGLLQLGAGEVGQVLPPVFVWWRSFAARYVAAQCLHSGCLHAGCLHAGATNGAAQTAMADIAAPDASELATLVLTAPIMPGAEYLTPDALRGLWADLAEAIGVAFAAAGTDLQSFLKELNPAWNLVGRVHFNLAENRRDTEAPFAFMATYTTQLSAQSRAQHMPLGKALQEYAGKANQQKLLALLMPVQRAAERCEWLRPLVDAGEIYHPLRWAPADAARLLARVDALEAAGIVVRLPATWSAQRPPRPKVSATVGARLPSKLGLDGLLAFNVDITLNGESLSEEEIATLLAGTDGLVMLRGQWVEVDRARLERAMQQFEAAEALSREKGLTFAEAMRMLAGPNMLDDAADASVADWSSVTAGPWLAQTLQTLRTPDGAGVDPGPALRGSLRPY